MAECTLRLGKKSFCYRSLPVPRRKPGSIVPPYWPVPIIEGFNHTEGCPLSGLAGPTVRIRFPPAASLPAVEVGHCGSRLLRLKRLSLAEPAQLAASPAIRSAPATASASLL